MTGSIVRRWILAIVLFVGVSTASVYATVTVSCQMRDGPQSFSLVLDHEAKRAVAYFPSLPTPQELRTVAWNENMLVLVFERSGAQYRLDRHTGAMEIVGNMNDREFLQCRPSKPTM
jgi:hypothetical protein